MSNLVSVGREGGAIIKNDGKSFQTGCGNDPIITGCCFEKDELTNIRYTCFKCDDEQLMVHPHEVECPKGALMKFEYFDIEEISSSFRYPIVGDVRVCGAKLHPTGDTYHLPIKYLPTRLDSIKKTDSLYTSDHFLCNRYSWEQGNFVNNVGLLDGAGSEFDHELEPGRHKRVNYNNFIKNISVSGHKWYAGEIVYGEGIFVCYNGGSCVAPDICECRTGYTGHDCRTPVCRYLQTSGEMVGCMNGGICIDKDRCECLKTPSILWMTYSESERGFTGYEGSDCSMPICTQGYYDPTCNDSKYAPGGQGCYRCHNGGQCIGPDECECSNGWSGYDCKTPICVVKATSEIRNQLMTTDENKVTLFENDPCGLGGFHTPSSDIHGHCVLPNKCTCTCKETYDSKLCRAFGGVHCKRPFKDRLSKYRNVLLPNEIFGTRECSSGYEGLTNDDNEFITCHLKIYEPTFFVKHSISMILFCVFISIILFRNCTWVLSSTLEKGSTNQNLKANQQRRQHSTTHSKNAFLFPKSSKTE